MRLKTNQTARLVLGLVLEPENVAIKIEKRVSNFQSTEYEN